VAEVQYTFTHKQYTEYGERIIHNNENNNIIGKCGPCPVFANYTLAFALQLRKSYGETSVRVVEKYPDIPVAVELNLNLSHFNIFSDIFLIVCIRTFLSVTNMYGCPGVYLFSEEFT
jgi:hypothetical protein